ncbi:MAG TPA: antitoxin VapB family protein [Thermoplasmata archaeon]|jgi:predicted CopG family antitoxin|nr:antitoxin VapB family protein [Thermoplasmata archaeon]
MEVKTVALDPEAYDLLRRRKRKGESFSDVVKRIAKPRRPITDLAGLWSRMPENEFRKIANAIRRGRELDIERQKELLRRMAQK